MNEITRITIALSEDEFTMLRETAAKECRHPREQARWLLRQVLIKKRNPGNVSEQPAAQTEELTFA